MNQELSLNSILNSFRSGKDSSYIYSELLSLFLPGTQTHKMYFPAFESEFLSALKEASIPYEESKYRLNIISKIISEGVINKIDLQIIESQLLSFYRPLINPERTIVNQTLRNERCFAMVKDHIVGNSVIDYGCGKGLLGLKIKTDLKKEVILVDNIDFNKSEMQLLHSEKNGKTNLPDKVSDTTIAYLVLHHMDNPFSGLQELSRITKSRIILMEGYIEKIEYQFINQVIDWFFNRILLGVDMNVPLNFLKLNQWEFLLKKVGFKITKTEYVGTDEKLAPEHHVLIIADRE